MMKRLDTPLAPTVFPNGGGDKKKKKKKEKVCRPGNMKACEGVGGPDAKGPGGKKGGPKKKRKGRMFGSGMSGKKREEAYYRQYAKPAPGPPSGLG
jgi:hypothetical protein